MADTAFRPSLQLNTSAIKDNVPNNILPGLWLGSIHSGFNAEGLNERGITHIINLSGLPATFPGAFTYLTIELRDKGTSDILSCIPACNIFIEAALEHGGVLVHCFGGRSRSSAIIIAFLMSTTNCSYDEALYRVRSERSVVAPNAGFEMQLRAYGAAGCDVYGAHQLLLHARLQRVGNAKRRRSVLVFRPRGRAGSFEADDLRGGDDHDDVDDTAGLGLPKQMSPVPLKDAPLPCPTVRRPAHLRLSRPNSKAVQVIPQLKGLEWAFRCRGCQNTLFLSSSIVPHKPGKDPMPPRDMSWMRPPPFAPAGAPAAVRDDDQEAKAPPASDESPASEFRPAAAVIGTGAAPLASPTVGVRAAGGVAFGAFRMPAAATTQAAGSSPPTSSVPPTPRAAMMQKAKSFAFGGSHGAAARDPFDFGGSAVPPTPSHRRGRNATTAKTKPSASWGEKKQRSRAPSPAAALGGVIEEGEEEEEEGDDDDEGDEEAVEVVDDEADAFDAAMAMGSPLKLGGGAAAPSGLGLSLGLPQADPTPEPPATVDVTLGIPTAAVAKVVSPAGVSPPKSSPPAAPPLSLALPAAVATAAPTAAADTAPATPCSPVTPVPSVRVQMATPSASPSVAAPTSAASRMAAGTPPLHPNALPSPSPRLPAVVSDAAGSCGPAVPPPPPPRPSMRSTPTRTPAGITPAAAESSRAVAPSPPPPTPPSVPASPAGGTASPATSVGSPASGRGVTAERTRFVEKMRWLEEAGLAEGQRRSDAEAARAAGGAGSNALSRRGLRRVRSSSAMQVAAADEAAATLHCECVFVEPLQWMGALRGRSGPLKCPTDGCCEELGFYDWTGASCTCGAFVKPAFCVQLNKVWRGQPSRPPSRHDE